MEFLLKLTPNKSTVDYHSKMKTIIEGKVINLIDFDVEQIDDIIFSYKNKIEDCILEKGLSWLIDIPSLNEDLIQKSSTDNQIIAFFHKFLDRIEVDGELIIIDPYFLNSKDSNYSNLFESIIGKYLTNVNSLIIITDANKDMQSVKNSIDSQLKSIKSSLNIIFKNSTEYHDRFWITNNREKGLITGTSMNSIGKKYSIIDRLQEDDVADIVSSLIANGLI